MKYPILNLGAALGLAAALALPNAATAADHLDSPLVRNDPAADINDLFAFVNPNDADELILAQTVLPAAGVGARFSDAVDYRFHIDNGMASIELTCTFSGNGARIACTGPDGLAAAGPINQTHAGTGMRVHAGRFDDPFFFDLEAYLQTVDTLMPQFTMPGDDFFADLGTLAIVVGIESDRVSAAGDAPVLKVFSTTTRTAGTGIQAGFSGSWFQPDNSGHGVTVQVLEGASPSAADRLYAIWNVYDNEGNQAWVYGVGEIDGNASTFDAFITDNGAFPPLFGAGQPDVRPWGTMTLRFDSCTAGELEYSTNASGFNAIGSLDLTRLTSIKDQDCALLTGGAIDRMGRPAINTALIDLLQDTGLTDVYNTTHDPMDWGQFTGEIQSNLEALDTLDGETGNALLPAADLAGVLVDDRLLIDVSVPTCDAYLAVELGVAGQCGGRTLSRDVIDDTFGATVGPGVSDNVGFTSPIRDDFPFLGEPGS